MFRIVAASVVALLTLAACAGGGVVEPSVVAVEGTYALQTIDGASLPYLIRDSAGTSTGIEVTAGTLTLAEGGTVSVVSSFRTVGSSETTPVTCSGFWTRSGDALSLALAGAGQCANISVAGTFSGGNTLTIAWAPSGGAQLSVYRR